MKYYAGVGSRKTPYPMLMLMHALADKFEDQGYTLRSGGASGADTAFQEGVKGSAKEIYLPWKGFNKLKDDPENNQIVITNHPLFEEAQEKAKSYHKKWDELKPFIQNLHTRNLFIVLGDDLNTPCEFMVCWAPWYGKGPLVQGGTGVAVRMARDNEIPVYNLLHEEHLKRMEKIVC
jgi:hypothetical protein